MICGDGGLVGSLGGLIVVIGLVGRSVVGVGLVVGGRVGEACDAEHEGVGDIDAAQISVLGDAVESGAEDVGRGPAVVLASFVDRGDQGGPCRGVAQIVGPLDANECGQDGAPGRGKRVGGVCVAVECGRAEVGDQAPPQGGGLVLIGQRSTADCCVEVVGDW